MKITTLFLFLGISNVFSMTYSQNKLLTLDLTGRPVKELIDAIEKQSEYVFFFSDELKKEIGQKVSVHADAETLDNVLTEAFKNTNLNYYIKDRQVTITKSIKNNSDTAAVGPELPQERRIIQGVVKDEHGDVLPGASVIVVGSTRGVTTDIDGTFSLQVSPTDKLIFGFLGMQDQVITVGDQTMLNVIMKEKIDELSEVTIVAFARQKKESVVSSISTVKPSELKVSSSNLTTALAGRIAGVIAYQRSGEPGKDNAEFFVRGITTFGTGNKPLILIDNVELAADDLSRLSPDDIASFSVLKDAAATALYGARGANGVILVTTKEGREGKVSVSFRFENSISSSVRDVKVSDPLTFMKLHNEAVRTRDPLGMLPYLDSEIAAREEGRNPYVYPMVDWKDMLFKKNTMNQRGNLSLNGGGSVARYYIALTYARDNGILSVDPVNNFNNNIQLNKYSVRSNVNLNLTKTTELAVRVSGTFDDYQGPISGGADMYNKAIKSNPVLFPATFEPDQANIYAKHILFGNSGTSADYMNPYAEMLKGYKESQTTVVIAQLELKQNLDVLTKGLRARLLGNTTRNSFYDLNRSYNPFYYTIGAYDKMTDIYTLTALNPDSGTDYLDYNPGDKKVSSSIYMEASLAYDRTFAKKHIVSGMLVFTARESMSANEETLQKSLPSRNLGLAGRFTYGFSERYFAELNFGYNGSERFAKHNRWGFFPSAGIGWIISKEQFWENTPWADQVQLFKLKASYGLVGNDNIDEERFFYLSEVNMNNANKGFSFGTDFNNATNGISISRYADDQIGWEVSYKLNLGVEFRLFNSLDIQADYFHEKRTNILQVREDIPTLMGLQAKPKANLGEAKGSGIDASLDYQKSFTKDLWMTARANFTYAKSKYSIYEEPDYSTTTPWLSRVGQKLSQQYGLIAERLFVDDEEVLNAPKQQFGNYMGGDIRYKDINKDGIIDSRDRVPIGHPTTPEIIYGFGFSAGYKNFDLSCFFQGSARSSFWIDAGAITPFVNSLKGKAGNNAVLDFIEKDHWSEANQNVYAAWPRLSAYAVANNNQRNTWFMRNGNFLRLKSAECGYTLPSTITQRMKMANLRVYLSGTNLLCFSNFKLWDPEMGGNGLGYPLQRVYNVGLQVSF